MSFKGRDLSDMVEQPNILGKAVPQIAWPHTVRALKVMIRTLNYTLKETRSAACTEVV